MKRLAILVLALAVAAPAAAEQRNLTGFSSINASGRVRVEATVGERHSVRVDGADSGEVVTSVRDGNLRISQRGANWFGSGRRLQAVVHVTAPRFDGFSAMRGAELSAEGPIPADSLSLSAAQGGSLSITGVRADELDIRASQGGAVNASGTCGAVRASASMGGAADADAVECASAHVSASMGGLVSVHARELVEASATMGGAVDVSGRPTRNDTSSMMGGSVSIR